MEKLLLLSSKLNISLDALLSVEKNRDAGVKKENLSKLFIIKFSEPLFACLFGALILNENILKWQYLIAFLLISFGIVLGNKSDNKAAVK